jgi:hypothetical protein
MKLGCFAAKLVSKEVHVVPDLVLLIDARIRPAVLYGAAFKGVVLRNLHRIVDRSTRFQNYSLESI